MTADRIIALVDDDAEVLAALGRLLRAEGFVVRPFASAREFMDARDGGPTSCIVLDVAMPEIDGLELQQRLTMDGTAPPIVFMTGHGDIPMSVQAMKAGAVNFLQKPVDRADLLHAIHTACALAEAGASAEAEKTSLREKLATLTVRERQVFEQIVKGKLNKQIAAEFGTDVHTVKVQRRAVLEKVAADSITDLVKVAVRLGLITE